MEKRIKGRDRTMEKRIKGRDRTRRTRMEEEIKGGSEEGI
jgi:hypothetical protein